MKKLLLLTLFTIISDITASQTLLAPLNKSESLTLYKPLLSCDDDSDVWNNIPHSSLLKDLDLTLLLDNILAPPTMLAKFDTQESVHMIAINKAGTMIVAALEDGTARVWDLQTKERTILPHPMNEQENQKPKLITAMFNQTGTKILTSSNDGIAIIWDAHTKKQLRSLRGHNGFVMFTLSDNPNSADRLVAEFNTHDDEYPQRTIELLDKENDKPVYTLNLDSNTSPNHWKTKSVAVFGDKLFHTNNKKGAITRISTSECLIELDEELHGNPSPAFNKEGNKLVVTLADGIHQRIFDTTTGQPLSKQFGLGKRRVVSTEFSHDGNKLLTFGTNSVRVWDTTTGKLSALIKDPSIFCAAFNVIENTIITGHHKGTIKQWSLSKLEASREYQEALSRVHKFVLLYVFVMKKALIHISKKKCTSLEKMSHESIYIDEIPVDNFMRTFVNNYRPFLVELKDIDFFKTLHHYELPSCNSEFATCLRKMLLNKYARNALPLQYAFRGLDPRIKEAIKKRLNMCDAMSLEDGELDLIR